ncbi:MAG: hypothetical protein ACTSQJ_03435 [Promethearchaeota archaeon]
MVKEKYFKLISIFLIVIIIIYILITIITVFAITEITTDAFMMSFLLQQLNIFGYGFYREFVLLVAPTILLLIINTKKIGDEIRITLVKFMSIASIIFIICNLLIVNITITGHEYISENSAFTQLFITLNVIYSLTLSLYIIILLIAFITARSDRK